MSSSPRPIPPGALELALKRETRLVRTACGLMGFAFLMVLGLLGVGLWLRLAVINRFQEALMADTELQVADFARVKLIGTALSLSLFGLFMISALGGCGYLIAWARSVRRRAGEG